MKTKTIILTWVLLTTLYSSVLFGAPGESLVLDPASGDYSITYADNLGNLQHSTFVPATKIEPVISSAFKLNDSGIIAYRYTIANGKGAKQSISSAGIYNISSLHYNLPLPPYRSGTTLEEGLAVSRIWNAPIVTPDRWRGYAAPDPDHASLFRANWSFSAEENPNEQHYIGVTPGKKQIGFGFASRELPGIGKFKLWGDTPVDEGYVDEGPKPSSEVGKQLRVLETNNFVLRNAAVPTIAVPTLFDPAVTLERIQAHMQTWIAMQLLDPVFSSQLDRSFQTAISAYRLNQPKVGKKQIQTMRELIKKEQPDADREEAGDDDEHNKNQRALIDKLAARILDFDLKYVMKRAGGDKDD
jgi:hypothetical protein